MKNLLCKILGHRLSYTDEGLPFYSGGPIWKCTRCKQLPNPCPSPITKRDADNTIKAASAHDDLDLVKYLVSIGCDPQADENFPIRIAADNGNLEMVKYFVEIGCDPTAQNNRPLRWATKSGNLDVVKYLTSIGCRLS